MYWRITVEAVDPTGEEYRQEFLFEKSLDGLTDGRIGCSIEDGKVIMAEIQQAVVQAVNPAVNRQFLPSSPGVLGDSRVTDIRHLSRDVQLTQ